MNEGKAREDMARADKAEAVLRNETFIESFEYLEDEFTKAFVEGGNQMMRPMLEERAREIGMLVDPNEDDLTLASRILSHGSTAKRRFRIVPASDSSDGDEIRSCALKNCANNAIDGSKFCSLACAEKAFSSLKRGKARSVVTTMSNVTRDGPREFHGEECDDTIMALENPFGEGTGAHEVFELFRIGGTKETLVERFGRIMVEKGIKCISPIERVRRVITDTRRAGFELSKTKGGFFRLTGRRRK